MLIARTEGPGYRIQNNQNARMAALLFKPFDGHGQCLGVDNAASQVKLATHHREGNIRHAVLLTPSRNAPFSKLLTFRREENYKTLFHLPAVPIHTSRDMTADIAD
jgi:hypothetical protein